MRIRFSWRFIADVIFVIIIFIGVVIGASLLPIKNNFKILAVLSGSMSPTISVGSLAVVMPASEYKVGDIITFKQTDEASKKLTTTHRISSIENSNGVPFFATKGDTNNAADNALISKEQIIGKYRFSVPLLGYLVKYIQTPIGLVLIIIIPSTLIIYEEARKIISEVKKIRNNKNSKKNKKSKVAKKGKGNEKNLS